MEMQIAPPPFLSFLPLNAVVVYITCRSAEGGGGGDSDAEGYFDIGYSIPRSAAAAALRCLQHMALLSLKPTARLAAAVEGAAAAGRRAIYYH